MPQRPLQALELQGRDLVARGLLDRLEAVRLVGRQIELHAAPGLRLGWAALSFQPKRRSSRPPGITRCRLPGPPPISGSATGVLVRAGIPANTAKAWLRLAPSIGNNFRADAAACSKFWAAGAKLRAQLPARPARGPDAVAAIAFIEQSERELRERFLAAHAATVYDRLTNNRRKFVRVAELVREAAKLVPGLTPTAKQLAAEAPLALKDKERIEIDQGLFLAHVMADPAAGRHLCHAMLLPRAESAEVLQRLIKDGSVDLGSAAVLRIGKAAVVEIRRPRFLNAMDYEWMAAIEIAVDLAILDPKTEIAVLRGGVVDNPKYRRVFSSGINLTLLYQGKIPYLFYIDHLLGFEHKIFRGLARPDVVPDDTAGATIEKAWIAAVDGFAIGGGCQHLLVMDYVLAGRRLHDAAGAQGGHHPRRLQHAAAALRRRPHRAAGDHVRPPARLRQPGRPHDLRRGRAAGADGRGAGRRDRRDDQLRRGQRGVEPARRSASARSRSICSGAMSRCTRASRPICHFSPALIANLERTGTPCSARPDRWQHE